MGRTVIVDVVQGEELNVSFAATDTPQITSSVVLRRGQPIFAEAGFPMLVVADLAPCVRPGPLRSQVVLGDRLLLPTLRAALSLERFTRQTLEPADVV